MPYRVDALLGNKANLIGYNMHALLGDNACLDEYHVTISESWHELFH